MTIIRNECHISAKNIYAAFVDFRKAFDVTNCSMLFYRLREQGIKGTFLDLITEMYKCTVNAIRINSELSPIFVSENGLRRGDNQSPTLFSLYINDLLCEFKKSQAGVNLNGIGTVNVLAYADDIVLVSETETGLKELLNILGTWCRKWRVQINATKTKVVHFRKKNVPETNYQFQVGKERLDTVSMYRYLGITLGCHLENEYITDQLTKAASRALGSLISKTRSVYDLDYGSYTKLYNTCITSILDYRSAAWNVGHDHTKIDAVQNRAIRYYCGLPRNVSILGMIGEIGWLPSIVRRDLESLRLYNQVVCMNDDRLTKKIFKYDRQCKGSWSQNIINICKCLDVTDSWENESPINIKFAKTELFKAYKRVWLNELVTKSKLHNLSKIKNEMSVSKHVAANLNKHKRSLISQIRLGSLPLQIELGRYQGLERHERICKICGTETECELHFLFRCQAYSNRRTQLYQKFPEILNYADDTDKFGFMCNMPHALGNYLSDIWKERALLYGNMNNMNDVNICV